MLVKVGFRFGVGPVMLLNFSSHAAPLNTSSTPTARDITRCMSIRRVSFLFFVADGGRRVCDSKPHAAASARNL
jgi:hypothetical protein